MSKEELEDNELEKLLDMVIGDAHHTPADKISRDDLRVCVRNLLSLREYNVRAEELKAQINYKRTLFLRLKGKSQDVLGTHVITVKRMTKIFDQFHIRPKVVVDSHAEESEQS